MADPATLGRRLAAEALGTFVLVLLGVGAALMSGGDTVATGLGFGLAVLVMGYAVGYVSGGHFNPAVSLGAVLGGRLSWRDAALYGLVQVGGGLLGGLALWVVMHGFPGFSSASGLGQNSFGDASPDGYAWWAAFLLETLLTALLVGVVLGVTDARNPHPALAPLAIGLALAAIHFASLGATGTSVNPARSVGVGVFAGSEAISQLWLFIAAPLVGGGLAGLLHPLVLGRDAAAVPRSGLGRARAHGAHAATGWETGGEATWPTEEPGPPRVWGHPDPTKSGQPWAAPWETPPPDAGPVEPWDGLGLPAPTEPYWSQQLPQEWEPRPDDDDGRTQVRPADET